MGRSGGVGNWCVRMAFFYRCKSVRGGVRAVGREGLEKGFLTFGNELLGFDFSFQNKFYLMEMAGYLY